MAAVCHLGFLKFNFLTVRVVKRPVLHRPAKIRRDWSNRCGDIAIFVIFKMAAAAILDFQSRNFNGRFAVGANVRHLPKFIKIGQTVAQIWRFNGFQNGGLQPSWICQIQFF